MNNTERVSALLTSPDKMPMVTIVALLTIRNVDEVHVLKFPDHETFDRYRSDDGLLALAALRERAISQTTAYVSTIEVDYSAQE